MNTILVFACAVALFSGASFAVRDTQMCLTWNVTEDHLFLKCYVFRLEYNMQIIDMVHQIRAECTKTTSLNCTTNSGDDTIFTNVSANGFSLVLKTTKTNEEGDWKCLHGTNEAKVNINLLEGTVYSADVQLSGEVSEMKDHFKFTLTCFSCWIPYTQNVYFFVNDVLEDNVRYSDGKCYHKRKACSPTECTCSNEGNNFTWGFISDLSYLKFSCEMKFKDENTSTLSIQTANILFNETEFKQDVNRINIIKGSEKAGGLKKDTTVDKNNWTTSLTTLFLAICIPILLWVFRDNIQASCGGQADRSGVKKGVIGGTHQRETNGGGDQHRTNGEHEQPDAIVDSLKGMTGAQCAKEKLCFECKYTISCEVCIDCKSFYCGLCCIFHIQCNPTHTVCQLQHAVISEKKAKCWECKQLATKICFVDNSFKVSCPLHASCDHNHDNRSVMNIYQTPSVDKTPKTDDVKHTLIYDKTVRFQKDEYPVCICGIEYLENGSLVALDYNNHKLIVFTSYAESFNKYFENEPRAMTTTCKLMENRIAITFPHIKVIKIYDINLKDDKLDRPVQGFSMAELGKPKDKPFSIAYNHGWFAIEIGERENGRIIIVDCFTKKILYTIGCKIAYFTGHTIRLALDKKEGVLFVTAIGKRLVSCVDFQGKIKWNISDSSPRSILLLEDTIFGKSLLLSSKVCGAIYQLNKENGKHVILTKDISSPRFIAHHSSANQLCILVKNPKNDDVDELAIYNIQERKDDRPRSKSHTKKEL